MIKVTTKLIKKEFGASKDVFVFDSVIYKNELLREYKKDLLKRLGNINSHKYNRIENKEIIKNSKTFDELLESFNSFNNSYKLVIYVYRNNELKLIGKNLSFEKLEDLKNGLKNK